MHSIEPHPDAPEGSVSRLSRYTPQAFTPGSAVICRNNAPLIAFAFDLIRRGVRPLMLGRDLGSGLVALVKKLDAHDMSTLRRRLDEFEKRETDRLLNKGRGREADAVADRCTCLRIFLRNAFDPASVIANIELMFSDKTGTVTLASIHKAKGLEWESVFLLDRGLIPSRWATQEWELQQERNLLYVAITRAKLNLTYIVSDSWQ